MARKSTIAIEIGNIFHTWEVINKEEGNKNYNYICKCISCGKEKSISKYNLVKNTYALCKECGIKSVLESNIDAILKYWNCDLNGSHTIEELISNPSATYWFTCSKGHNFRKTLRDFSPEHCPTCKKKTIPATVPSRKFKGKSFAECSPHLLEYWNYRKNKEKPNEVYIDTSKKKYWFTCTEGHEFQLTIKEVLSGKWCVYCSDNFSENRMTIICNELMEAIFDNVSVASEGNIVLIEDLHLAIALYSEHHFRFSRSFYQKESQFTNQLMKDLQVKKKYNRLGYEFKIVEISKNFDENVDKFKKLLIEYTQKL